MKMTVTPYDMKRIMAEMERDYFSIAALEMLDTMYDDEAEFDPVGICCEWNEYGGYGAALSFDDLINDYGYLLNDDEKKTVDNVARELDERQAVYRLANGNYLVSAY